MTIITQTKRGQKRHTHVHTRHADVSDTYRTVSLLVARHRVHPADVAIAVVLFILGVAGVAGEVVAGT